MKRLAPPDAVAFLLMENGRRPINMGGLQVFSPPEGAGPGFARDTYDAMRRRTHVDPLFAGHPSTVLGRHALLLWDYDDEIDLDYHFRYVALPEPGGRRELFELISRLHGRALDRSRPLWEVHLIDGLSGGRFAIFTKTHHGLFDGVSFISLMRRSLTTDPRRGQVGALWSLRPEPRRKSHDLVPLDLWRATHPAASGQSRWGLGRSVSESVTALRASLRERDLFPVFRAPPTIFNAKSDVPWVFAVQAWPLSRVDAVKHAAGVTVSDVALAMCSGAVRALLAEREALPALPLVAVVPVDLRTGDDVEGRNVMTSAVCNLATNLEDPAERLATIHASMNYNKELLRSLPKQVSMYLAGVIGAPVTDGSFLDTVIPPQFNVGISLVSDTKEARYQNGARLEGTYGFPPTLRGHAFNIGMIRNAASLNFGIVACADVVPDLEPFLEYLEAALKDLERAVGL